MAKAKWIAFPHASKSFVFKGEALRKAWEKLHKGDREPFPKDPKVLEAWRLFHQGEFEAAVEKGLAAGGAGITAANKAEAIYANGVETRDAARVTHLDAVMKRAEAQARADPKCANAHYLYAYAAGRYSQRISVVKALTEGYGGRIRKALEAALALDAKHADAHTAMGMFHAEILDKVGALVGGMTYGAKRDAGEEHLRKAMKLNPDSPIACSEAANGLLMLHGRKALEQARELHARAAAMKPRDAMEWIDVEAAKARVR
jgi:tetratricopeptide (TPR) repeat protein